MEQQNLCYDALLSSCQRPCTMDHEIQDHHLNGESKHILQPLLWAHLSHCKDYLVCGNCTKSGCTNDREHIITRSHLSDKEQCRLDSFVSENSNFNGPTRSLDKTPKLVLPPLTPPSSPPHNSPTLSASHTEKPGDVIANYRLIRKIGVGSHGTVWQGKSIHNGQMFALKQTKFFNHGELLKRTYREVKLLQYFAKENHTVTMYDLVTKESTETFNSVFLVMEMCDTDLQKLITFTPFSVQTIKLFTFQIVSAIRTLHRANVIHRDLKPQNILIVKNSDQYQLKLCDFGTGRGEVTKIQDPRRTTLSDVTTLYYCAPEGILNKDIYSNSVDCWALGCIVAEMLIRSPLLPGDGTAQDQLRLIAGICGKPSPMEVSHFPDSPEKRYLLNHQDGVAYSLDQIFEMQLQLNPVDIVGVKEFVQQLLVFNPNNRLSSQLAYEHPFLEPLNRTNPKNCSEILPFQNCESPDEKATPVTWKQLLWEEVQYYQNRKTAPPAETIR